MTKSFCVAIRFLQQASHGRGGDGQPEWPPSPLRVFQSLVAAAAARWNERGRLESAAPALRWLERQPPPLIVACRGRPSRVKYRLYVPDNIGDKVGASWSAGRAATIADYRTEKDVCPVHLAHDGGSVYYLWRLAASDRDFEKHNAILTAAARSITHLGWGVDMVAADATVISEADANQLAGERWLPTAERTGIGRRVPVDGTLPALIRKYDAFLARIGPDGFKPVPPLSTFGVVGYRRATDPPAPAFAAFSILKPDASGFRPFDTVHRGLVVAAMIRHAASADNITRALGWPSEKVAAFVLGHGESLGEAHAPVQGPRLAFVPLPSIESRDGGRAKFVGSIRRALVVTSIGEAGDDLQRIARLLSGADLVAEGQAEPVALLSRIPASDSVVDRYVTAAATWATVTPVVLPGYDDPRKLRRRLFRGPEPAVPTASEPAQKELLAKLDRRIDDLLRKAIRQAGYAAELARDAQLDWRSTGFLPGTDLSSRYAYPEKLRRYRRLHVRITWRDASGQPLQVRGPVCLGGGRFHGLGLFASV
ncbi:MAG: type I-U CRISPR-associated protein Csb2 [Isosphaeraceae bacterium]